MVSSNAALMMTVDNDDTEGGAPVTGGRSLEDHRQSLRMVEAMLFASAQPLAAEVLAERLPDGSEIHGLLRELQQFYASRGVNLVQVAGGWAFRTAGDLSFLLAREATEQRKLSRAALETLAIIAYHQPVTRAEIEEIRGVATSSGTIDVLLETGWLRMRGRRKTPGRPITYGTTDAFLAHFGLDSVSDLPGVEELKAAGLLDSRVPPDFTIPEPQGGDELTADEDPLEDPVEAGVAAADAVTAEGEAAAVVAEVPSADADDDGAPAAEGPEAAMEPAEVPEMATEETVAEAVAATEIVAEAVAPDDAGAAETDETAPYGGDPR